MSIEELDNLDVGKVIYYGGNYSVVTEMDDIYYKIFCLNSHYGFMSNISKNQLLTECVEVVDRDKLPKDISYLLDIHSKYMEECPNGMSEIEYMNRYMLVNRVVKDINV